MEHLIASCALRTPRIADAFRHVAREEFLPVESHDQVYQDVALPVRNEAGVAVSSASQPRAIALMLEGLEPRDGWRILELGVGVGYQAALLAELVGPRGRVLGVDIVPDLVDAANSAFQRLGLLNVSAEVGDGGRGVSAQAPWDAIVVSACTAVIPRTWIDQLRTGGRLVAPVDLALPGATLFLRFDLLPDGRLHGVPFASGQYMPFQGMSRFTTPDPVRVQSDARVLSSNPTGHWEIARRQAARRTVLASMSLPEFGGFLHWLTFRQPWIMIESDAPVRYAEAFGISTRTWVGIATPDGVAIIGKSSPELTPAMHLDVFAYGAGDLETLVAEEYRAYVVVGRPAPHQYDFDVYPVTARPRTDANQFVVRRDWGVIVATVNLQRGEEFGT